MKKQNSFKNLTVWQRSLDLVELVYEITKQLPSSEVYALSTQMQRAAVSIPSNIAEGYKRNNRKEYIQFLAVANASAAELETQLIVLTRIYNRISTDTAEVMVVEVQKMLTVMIGKLQAKKS